MFISDQLYQLAKTGTRVLLVLFFTFGMESKGLSFVQDSTIQVWIDLQQKEGKVVFTGKLINRGSEFLELKYELLSEHQSSSGHSANTQTDKILAEPQTPKTLSVVSLGHQPEDSYLVVLKVYKGQKLIASDSLRYGRPLTQVPNIAKAPPAPTNTDQTQSSEDLEIDGLIIDETRSKIGHDFYDMFYRGWVPPSNAKDYIVVIKELPSRGRVARVSVFVNDEEVSRRVLQGRTDIIKMQVGNAIRHINYHLINRASLKKDLEDGDQQGSGIF